MAWGERLGTWRYWQQLGDPYAQMLREALKPALGATALSAYLGLTVVKALLIGLVMVVGLLGLSLAFGWLVWRHRVIHASIRRDWENNPVTLRQLELLEAIARNTSTGLRAAAEVEDPAQTFDSALAELKAAHRRLAAR